MAIQPLPELPRREDPRAEGYMRCYCGQWAVSYHSECAWLASVDPHTSEEP